jgi:hypothetical protein
VIISAPALRTPAAPRRSTHPALLAAAALVAGVALGATDLLLQRVLPYPWANLANSLAVWAVAAWLFGALVVGEAVRGAAAGVVLLVVAVEAYYLAAAVFQHDDLGLLTAPTTVLWCVFGVIAGVIFGAGGGAVGDARRGAAVLGAALPAAVLLGEAGVMVHRVAGERPAAGTLAVAAVEAGFGLLATLAARRRCGAVGVTLVVAMLLAVSAFGAFAVLGIGFAAA